MKLIKNFFNYFRVMLADDNGQPSSKLHAGVVGLIYLGILVIGHVNGEDYQEFVFWGTVIFTGSAFGIHAFERIKNNFGK